MDDTLKLHEQQQTSWSSNLPLFSNLLQSEITF